MTPERFRRIRQVLDHRQPDLAVLLDNVHKPHNLSAIMRTCDAVGAFEAHAVSTHATVQVHRETSAGAGKWVELFVHDTLGEGVGHLRQRGFHVVAAHQSPAAVDFRAVDYARPTALLLGAEKFGVSEAAAEDADTHVTIPMVGMVASLNVSVAAATILYEIQRQRALAGLYDAPRLDEAIYWKMVFKWGYPKLAERYDERGLPYPRLDEAGEIIDPIPEAIRRPEHDDKPTVSS